jgi:hypothetical protein
MAKHKPTDPAEQPGNQLINPVKAEFLPLAPMLDPDYAGPSQLSAVDLTTREGKRVVLNSKTRCTFLADDLQGRVFRLHAWYAERRHFKDDATGEDRIGVSVTLIDPDGQTVRFGSEAVMRALDDIRSLYGNGPWKEPLFLRIDKYKTRNGRQSYAIQEIDPDSVDADEKTWK